MLWIWQRRRISARELAEFVRSRRRRATADDVPVVPAEPGVAVIRAWLRPGVTARVVAVWRMPGGATIVRRYGDESSTHADLTLLALDAFGEVYAVAGREQRPVRVFVGVAAVRALLAQRADSFPRTELLPSARDLPLEIVRAIDKAIAAFPAEADAAAVRVRTMECQPPACAPIARKRSVVDVATDASMGRRRRGAGIACLTQDGRWRQAFVGAARDISVAEIAAIRLALDEFGGTADLHVFTDSRVAIRWAEAPSCAPASARPAAVAVHAALEAETLRLTWVKGHGDHALNLAADRLAVACRRAHEFRTEQSVANTIAQRIVAELRPPGNACA